MDFKKILSEGELYERLKLLGQGAFGKAYLVKQKKTGNLFVIKQMNISDMTVAEQQQTLKEAKIIQILDHTNIVKFKEVYITTSKKLNIVMQYADGGDISRKIAQNKKIGKLFEQSLILDWFTQICLAIKHVHDRKIIHRDIKGQNIFITKNNIVKLGDFGIARILNKTMDKARTVVGTPYYLSPEIIQNKPYSFKSDIWSMGVLLYQLCALSPPFTANSLQFLALKIVKGSYTPLQGNYSKQLKGLINEILVVDSNKRPTVNEILKKPFIVNRIKNYLSQAQHRVQFSHTVIHNYKFGCIQNQMKPEQKLKKQADMNKLKEEQKSKKIEQRKKKQIEQQRLRKIAQGKQIQRKLLQQKKVAFERKMIQEKKEREEKRIAQQKMKQLQQQKNKKYLEFARDEYLRNLQIKKHAEIKANLQMNPQPFAYQPPVTRLQTRQKKQRQKYDEQQKIKKYMEFNRQQYFRNQQIKKNAQKRANGNQSQRNKINKSEIKIDNKQPVNNFYEKKSSEQIDPENYINVLGNPNYQKKQQQFKQLIQGPQKINERPSSVQQPKRRPQIQKKQQEIEKNQLKKKIQQGRLKMKQDRQKYLQLQNNEQKQIQIKVGRWDDKKNQRQKQKNQIIKQISPKIDPPTVKTIHANKWNKNQSKQKRNQPIPKKQTPPFQLSRQQLKKIQQQNKLLQKMIQQGAEDEEKNQQQFLNMINQLKKIVDDVNVIQKIQQGLPDIKIKLELENQRKDDQVQPEKAKEFKEKQNFENESVNLQYFSDYSKLQSLRITLEDVFGTRNFIRAYRIIQKQFNSSGIGNVDIEKLQKMVNFIPQAIFQQYITLLMTLIVMENKINERN